MIRPTLNFTDLHFLRDRSKNSYLDKSLPNGGVAEIWYETSLDLLAYNGHDVIPKELRSLEQKLIKEGHAKEYLSALLEKAGDEDLKEEQSLLALTLATSSERLDAIKKVLSLIPREAQESCKARLANLEVVR